MEIISEGIISKSKMNTTMMEEEFRWSPPNVLSSCVLLYRYRI
jgi:hypothetical protein